MTTRRLTLIRLKPLREKLGGVSAATVYRRVADGTLPRQIRVGGLAVWDEAEVDAAIEAALASRDDTATA